MYLTLGYFNHIYFYEFCFERVLREWSVAFSRHARRPEKRGGERVVTSGDRREGRTRAWRWEKAGAGRGGEGKKKRLNTSRKWYKIYPYFFKGFAVPLRSVRILWISFWWVFPFRLLLHHFNPPRKSTVQSQLLNTNVNALGCFADFLLLHFALFATTVLSGHTFTDTFEAVLENETKRVWFFRGVAFSRVLRSRELRYLSRTFSVPWWLSSAAHK